MTSMASLTELATQVANKRAKKATKPPEASNTLSADYLATLLSWPNRMAGIRRFIVSLIKLKLK